MGKIEKRKVWAGLALIPPIVLVIVLFHSSALHLMVLLATFLGLREYYNLALPQSKWIERAVGIGLGLILSLTISFGDTREISSFLVMILLILAVLTMAASQDLSSAISKMGVSLFGLL